MNPDTIVAIATASGPAGIGIVRASGPQSLATAARLTGRDVPNQPGYTLRNAILRDPETDEPLDEGLLAVFVHPRSFTGEDVVEWQGHGGPATLARVLGAFLAAGARLARPGEFTERAFLNGKLDLTRAEAIADLVAARSETARRAALRQRTGALASAVEACGISLRRALAHLEASIDFPEEVGEVDTPAVEAALGEAAQQLDALLATAGYGRRLTEGITLALVGAPNAGKSSLLNALVGADRAIVTDIPGTTRDIVSEQLTIGGLPVTLLDTAGLRPTDDPIERLGIEKARAAAAQADVVLLVIDATTGVVPDEADSLPPDRTRAVVNKIDLAAPTPLNSYQSVAVSARTGEGLERLAEVIVQAAIGSDTEALGDAPLVTRARHEAALRSAAESVAQARQTLNEGLPPELIAVDAHAALQALGEITGATAREEIVAGIFAQFCLGK